MKKLLSLFLSLPIFCVSQTITKTIDFVNGPFENDVVSCGPTSQCDLGSSYRTISGTKISATQGCPEIVTLTCCPTTQVLPASYGWRGCNNYRI